MQSLTHEGDLRDIRQVDLILPDKCTYSKEAPTQRLCNFGHRQSPNLFSSLRNVNHRTYFIHNLKTTFTKLTGKLRGSKNIFVC